VITSRPAGDQARRYLDHFPPIEHQLVNCALWPGRNTRAKAAAVRAVPVDLYHQLMPYYGKSSLKAKMMRVVVVVAALVAVLVGCAPRDPVAYAQMVCGDPDQGLLLGSDEHVACVKSVAENAPSVLLAIGGAMLEPVRAAPDPYVN
jgi:hypothetical protein